MSITSRTYELASAIARDFLATGRQPDALPSYVRGCWAVLTPQQRNLFDGIPDLLYAVQHRAAVLSGRKAA